MTTERMIIWQGPSQLDGTPLVVLATGVPKLSKRGIGRAKSGNVKTGDMIQIAILRADVNPTEAIKLGLDRATCGTCPFTSKASGGDGSCYTHKNLRRGFAQTSTWKSHTANGSVPFDLERFRGQPVRFGSYGDPAAVPVEVWLPIVEVASGVTSYTHQWRTADKRFTTFTMASTDSLRERKQAREQFGYRSFMPIADLADKPKGMIVCPASKEMGMRTTCETCLMCSGTSAKQTRDIVIQKH
jgi:hypothetical protein